MKLEDLFLPLLTALVVDTVVGLLKKSPPFILSPYLRLWKQLSYLSTVLRDENFSKWQPAGQRFVALRAIKGQSEKQEGSQSAIDLLSYHLRNNTPSIVLGEPGSGKTTVLEALHYRIAQQAYRYILLLFFFLISIGAILLVYSPTFSLLWLISLFLWEILVYRGALPIFVEARSEFISGNIDEWYKALVKDRFGDKPLLASHYRTAFFVDGVNEVQATLYESFIEGWRALIKNQKLRQVIFTSRTGEDPSLRLGIEQVLTIQPLEDEGVKEFLRVYGSEKSKLLKRSFDRSQIERDFLELQSKNLLTEDGIGRNPYWLRMLVTLESGLYTRNRGKLFLRFTEELIKREINAKPEGRKRKLEWKNVVPLDLEMELLGIMALTMQEEERIGLSGEEGWRKACEMLQPRISDGSFRIEDVLHESEAATLLRIRYQERVEFVHHLVQEFFAAFVLRHETNWHRITKRIGDVRWWQTLFLLGGILDTQDSSLSYPNFVYQILNNALNEQSLFVAIGLLQSVEKPPADAVDAVINRLISTVGEEITPEYRRSIKDLQKILGDDVAEMFDQLCQKADIHTKIKGALLLSTLEGNRSAEKLIALLISEDEATANSIFKSLGAPAVWPLSKALGIDDDEIQARASKILKNIDIRGVAELIAGLRSVDPQVRVRAAVSLGNIGDPQAFDLLRNTLDDRNPGVRAGVAYALGQIQNPTVLSSLHYALHDPEWIVRWAAAFALGQIPHPDSVPALLSLLADPDIDVRVRSIETLGQIGHVRAFDYLLHASRANEPEIRGAACKALGYLHDLRALDNLFHALNDQEGEVRENAARGLGSLGDPRCTEQLIAHLDDTDYAVREAVAEALGNAGDSSAITKLTRIAESGGPEADIAWDAVQNILRRIGT